MRTGDRQVSDAFDLEWELQCQRVMKADCTINFLEVGESVHGGRYGLIRRGCYRCRVACVDARPWQWSALLFGKLEDSLREADGTSADTTAIVDQLQLLGIQQVLCGAGGASEPGDYPGSQHRPRFVARLLRCCV